MSKYFVNDPECGTEFFDTEEEAKAHAEDILGAYRDDAGDGWAESVQSLCWGKVLGGVVQTRCDKSPPGSEFEEMWDFELRADGEE